MAIFKEKRGKKVHTPTTSSIKSTRNPPKRVIKKTTSHPPKQLNTGVTICKKLMNANDDALKKEIASRARNFYNGEEAKTLQIDVVANLARGRNTFLLAGTGYGKSRISEMYFKLLPQNTKPVILVLNPLDALGENQVAEKQGKFSAINLTKLTFNKNEADKIQRGDYNFVYLSPEIFMNNKLWDSIYFSTEFQQRLALVVVDEAHMIYLWGLVETLHLQSRNNAPLLMLSATCRPVAIDAILKSLKLTEDLIDIKRGELSRKEIRIIHIKMDCSLQSSLDLLNVFPTKQKTSDEDLVPTLIYSGTRARTFTVLQVLDMARGTPQNCLDPNNTLARRFHACTGDKDKVDVVEGFSKGQFPIISSTMALGLGQNWKRVRCVIHMGRADPENVMQMIGRCGRDGKDGLAILFVEGNRKGGKNAINDFVNVQNQSDDDRMDALAITPVCLRVAFAIDNKHGYIPLSKTDSNYIAEIDREKLCQFPPCRCSNCNVESGMKLIENLKELSIHNFDDAMNDRAEFTHVSNGQTSVKRKQTRCGKTLLGGEAGKEIVVKFKECLLSSFREYYNNRKARSCRFSAHDVFREEHADAIIANLDNLDDLDSLERIVGGEVIEGQIEFILNSIASFKIGSDYQNHLKNQERLKEEVEEARKKKRRESAARYRAKKKAMLEEARAKQHKSN
ncbi:uncharacterized protein PGTG_19415 [Puccinia graminis f. sp. tritici CRL 75-36-700-3]|uniref:DNA 3'-5' helicase n=1 Tax=Puccinia graminis f. sp. tritici (strain CRL 75-36-700-3 / race SCCL) TaxID=418459 RepID=E3LA22_PUCGT|nr:uncharacterized protein PGTG_19415 [Puccinia graminis f. sp. tritici CRL 75-36-700-3]EFP93397.2 hypothetical protein PGTG_19415 [Puccinia graminis f. sp. tritici CRL 75-36-700-3]